MARKYSRKKSSNKIVIILVAILVVCVLILGVLFTQTAWGIAVWRELKDSFGWEDPVDPNPSQDDPFVQIETGELSIHFMELGNKYTGDSTLIKIGDTEVLIDAGSRQNSAATIVPYIQQYCTDGVLEYVIATHAHQDHIAGFVGTKSAPGIFESFVCETIIDFPLTNATSGIYNSYCTSRDAEVAAGATHYTALECWNNENGAQRTYELGDGITLNILYSYFYEHKSSNENNYSVCVLLSQGTNHYLFTGDLEEDGEEYLVQYNTLPQVKLFKAGHHGSYTASSDALLSVIRPEIVCVCCCCGSDEYTSTDENQFPSQAFCTRVAQYTEQVYVTTIATEDGFASMNGNIVIKSTGGEVTVTCSNNNTLLKDTDWFRAHRKPWGQ